MSTVRVRGKQEKYGGRRNRRRPQKRAKSIAPPRGGGDFGQDRVRRRASLAGICTASAPPGDHGQQGGTAQRDRRPSSAALLKTRSAFLASDQVAASASIQSARISTDRARGQALPTNCRCR
jgi:hypothetical protein